MLKIFCLTLFLNIFNASIKNIFDIVEREENIPSNLLEAISICESSKDFRNISTPHPWTISVSGKAFYFKTKNEAIDAIKFLQKKGITNIDVGCMQINLAHHGKNFKSLEDAIDPYKNIIYAAKFLNKLRKVSDNWLVAMSRYHSYNKELSSKYITRVLSVWKKLRSNVYFVKKINKKIENKNFSSKSYVNLLYKKHFNKIIY